MIRNDGFNRSEVIFFFFFFYHRVAIIVQCSSSTQYGKRIKFNVEDTQRKVFVFRDQVYLAAIKTLTHSLFPLFLRHAGYLHICNPTCLWCLGCLLSRLSVLILFTSPSWCFLVRAQQEVTKEKEKISRAVTVRTRQISRARLNSSRENISLSHRFRRLPADT